MCLGVLCVRDKINKRSCEPVCVWAYCVSMINKRLFEPFCVWILCLNGLGCLVVRDEDADVSDVFWIDWWYNCEDKEPDGVPW